MADLQLELLRRNARLRAWRVVGVPVEGGWEKYVADDASGALTFFGFLTLRCGRCREEWREAQYGDETLEQVEHRALRRLADPPLGHRQRPCPHLVPLLGDDPPEVQAIAELELLAGDSR